MKDFLQKEYDFYLGIQAWKVLKQITRDRRVVVMCDRNTYRHCWPLLKPVLPEADRVVIPAGELHKNLTTVTQVYNRLLQLECGRDTLLLCLGGGMVCDLGGFVAATFKRGISFWHIPTSLMAMTDAAIGGKVGVDHLGYKNVIGAFQQPERLLILPEFLKTLPEHELRSGMAEVLKHGLLQGIKPFQEAVRCGKEKKIPDNLLQSSVRYKLSIVKKDPYEKKLRKVLNFGHTIGHAVESWSIATQRKPLPHGEAVAIGMIGEVWLSRHLLGLPEKEFELAIQGIRQVFPKRTVDAEPAALLKWMRNDKKNKGSDIRFALLRRIGKPEPETSADEKIILKALSFCLSPDE